ncbi:hypothetical protein GIB67_036632 [Kingdonia uniflora]|uniref:AP2/ERF domain-containing protein n=1 Tax=Kingdonia uniflora TaxID=39325 RepID=A0A7J7LW93_9MAGN|nr:hypothetical protein GIB67_036632 [Kingdonia uniflora]
MKGKGGLENSDCKFRGVRQRTYEKWVSEIREPKTKKHHWLGTFDTAVDAAHAYDKAALDMHGNGTQLNLPQDLAVEMEYSTMALDQAENDGVVELETDDDREDGVAMIEADDKKESREKGGQVESDDRKDDSRIESKPCLVDEFSLLTDEANMENEIFDLDALILKTSISLHNEARLMQDSDECVYDDPVQLPSNENDQSSHLTLDYYDFDLSQLFSEDHGCNTT